MESPQTYGGYSTKVVVDQRYVLRIPKQLRPEEAAPLLCAGITTYSPCAIGGGKETSTGGGRPGGLGHMARQNRRGLRSSRHRAEPFRQKRRDAKRLGAKDFFKTSDPKTFTTLAKQFDFILDTVSAPHDLDAQLNYSRPTAR